MTIAEIKARLSEFCNIFRFEYRGANCYLDPIGRSDGWGFDIVCGDEDWHQSFADVNAVLDAPLFFGKSLSEIYGEIDIIEM